MTLVDRYRDGEYREVWDELVAMGARAREPDLMPEVVAVAEETMSVRSSQSRNRTLMLSRRWMRRIASARSGAMLTTRVFTGRATGWFSTVSVT
jgi:hypothetical protein